MPSVHEEVSTARRDGYLRGLRTALLHLRDADPAVLHRLEQEYRRVVSGGPLPD